MVGKMGGFGLFGVVFKGRLNRNLSKPGVRAKKPEEEKKEENFLD
jgi:hypothetical protein